MFLRKSTINDIKEITAISIKAFGSDIQVGGKETGGPPDYDSESWHRKMMEQNKLERKERSKKEREAESNRLFEMKQQKKREKHNGH